MNNEFYVTLPSNACRDVYPENSATRFTTDLSASHEIDGDWEVGLKQIQFTNNWPNLPREFVFVAFRLLDYDSRETVPKSPIMDSVGLELSDLRNSSDEAYPEKLVQQRCFTIPVSCWNTTGELRTHVARMLQTAFRTEENDLAIVAIRNNALRTTSFQASSGTLGFHSRDDELFSIMGMPEISFSHRPRGGDDVPRIRQYQFRKINTAARQEGLIDVETVFLYSNICEQQHMGDHTGNILKLMPVTAKKNERQCNEFDNPSYVRVKPGTLRTISMRLCDKDGHDLRFDEGRTFTVVQLHFRKHTQRWY
jgi:hypothetical protein